MPDTPAYTPARLTRSIARYIAARADEIQARTPLERELAAALVRYWEAAAMKASGR